jgi:hypothetical protein
MKPTGAAHRRQSKFLASLLTRDNIDHHLR